MNWVEAFILGFLSSLLVNLLFLSVALPKWFANRKLKWFWGPFPNRRVQITFSLIQDLDDPALFRTRRVAAHIGDALAAALINSFLNVKLSAEAALAMHLSRPDDNASFVGIGGPRLNDATRNLLTTLSNSWELPFAFTSADDLWIIRGPHTDYELCALNRRVTQDFGIVAKLPHPGVVAQPTGNGASHHVCLLLAGISTFGTLGAARFALDPDCVKSMRRQLRTNCRRDPPYFMAIISTRPDTHYTGVDVSSIELVDVQPVSKRGLRVPR